MSDDVTRGAAIIGPRGGLCATCFGALSAKQKANLRKAMAKEIASTPAMPVLVLTDTTISQSGSAVRNWSRKLRALSDSPTDAQCSQSRRASQNLRYRCR